MVLITAGIVLQCVLFPVWLLYKSLVIPAFIHGVSVSLFIAYLALKSKGFSLRNVSLPVYFYGLFLFAFFPGFGWICMLLTLIITGNVRDIVKAGLFDDYEKYISEETEHEQHFENTAAMMRKVRREISFEPYIDIICGNEDSAKARVIDKLSRIITRDSVMLLKKALADESSDIRIYAAGAMTRIEDTLRNRIRAAQSNTLKQGSPEDYAELADLLCLYARLDLLEERLAEYYLNLGLTAYRHSLAQDPEQTQVIVKCAQCLVELSEYRQAQELLDASAELLPEKAEIVFLKSEIYFRLNKFGEVVKCLQKIRDVHLGEEQKRIVEFWTSGT